MGWGASPLPSSILMEGKPVKVLGRPAKTDAHLRGFGASPMPSSIYRIKIVGELVGIQNLAEVVRAHHPVPFKKVGI